MGTFIEFVKVLGLVALCFIFLMIIFGVIDGTINYIKGKKAKKHLEEVIDEELANIIAEIEKTKEKKPRKRAKKIKKDE